jgi:membrane protein implicated in regulation of membrane protease activity
VVEMSLLALWLILALAAGIVEIVIPALVFLFVGVAAALTAGVAWLGFPVAGQVVFFAAAALLLLLLVRPVVASKRLASKGVPSRTEALAGKRGRVTEEIDPVRGTGRVDIGGEDWAASSPEPVAAGTDVRVDGADGIVLIVSVVTSAISTK